MKQNAKADIAPAKVSDNLVKEVLHLVAATTATKPELPEHARQRLQAKVKATFALAECGQHTPGPWIACYDTILVESNNELVAECKSRHYGKAEDAANAAHIAHCCNAHDQLVSALQAILDSEDTTLADGGVILSENIRSAAKAALAQAQKEGI